MEELDNNSIITLFSKQLSALIEENKNLKAHIKDTEEWFKLAICLNNKLDYRSREKMNDINYEYFMDNTVIAYSSHGINLIWKNEVPVKLDGRTVLGRTPVTLAEIEEIFNGKNLV
jgi:hypothetical protein